MTTNSIPMQWAGNISNRPMRLILRWLVVLACFVDVLGGNVAFAGKPLARPAKHEACEHLERGNKLYNELCLSLPAE